MTPQKQDLITHQEYDLAGREMNTWLPVVSGKNGSSISFDELKTKSKTTYNDQAAYSRPKYEVSSLNRVLEQYGPGAEWHNNGKSVKMQYQANKSGDNTLNCIIYKAENVSGNDTIIKISRINNYATNELYVTRSEDEDKRNVSYEFKDKLGQVLLIRQINNNSNYDTYYIYDDLGNLKAVLPPLASDAMKSGTSWQNNTSDMIRNYCYLYTYDGHNRCIAKRLPGCNWEYYVYDKADRLILSQNGEQRKNNKNEWAFNIYDAFGRVILSGIHQINKSHETLKNEYQNKLVCEKAQNGNPYGYTWGSLPDVTFAGVLQINHYDDYNHLLTQDSQIRGKIGYRQETGYGVCYGYNIPNYPAKGLLVGTRTMILGSNGAEIVTAMYYDERGRMVQTRSTNHMGGIDSEYYAYNFSGQPVRKLHEHTAPGKATQKEVYTYTYDHAGRLKETRHKLNNNSEILLAQNEYDELGRLKETKANNNDRLKIVYTYNTRSWTRSINNNHFYQKLIYNYNGNVLQMDWEQGSKTRKYVFSHDNISRLIKAVGNITVDGKIHDYSSSYSYDKHGNMLFAKRLTYISSANKSEPIDSLEYKYIGNQLKSVEEKGYEYRTSTIPDFQNYYTGTVEYAFNRNGAMEKDLNRGISAIRYNMLNLPQEVDVKSPVAEARISYVYSASGTKLQSLQKWNPAFSTQPVIGSAVNVPSLTRNKKTDYVGNKIYEDGILKKILIENGYYEGGKYYFYIKDHLGNNRITADQNAGVVQSMQYYPFGMVMAGSSGQDKQPYKYGAKEFESMHGLNQYDFHARHYDSATARFTTMDPLAEKYYSWSPYNYCASNPMKYIDVDGRQWGIASNGQNKIIITVNVSFSTSTNISSTMLNAYKAAIATEFHNTLHASSGGMISGIVTFNVNTTNNQVVPVIDLYGNIESSAILGNTSFENIGLNIRNNDGSLRNSESVGVDATHELFHTLQLDHPFSLTQTSDTKLIKLGNGNYGMTSNTDKDIRSNIMNYGYTKINGVSFDELRSGKQNKLTKGQLSFIQKAIKLQQKGYGVMPKWNSCKSQQENEKKQKEYYWNYWTIFPGDEVK